MTKGKTITTYLVDGNPNGIRTCFISNKICKAVVVPRAKLLDAKKRAELQQPALYALLSDSEDKIYIGETEDFLSRIRDHEAKKSFWKKAIIFVSKDNDLTKSDVKYLEYLAIGQAQMTSRYNIEENKNTEATGFYSENGFTVLKGSKIPSNPTPSYTNKAARAEKLSASSTSINENQLELTKGLTFKSPSAASSFCFGNPSNGWIAWVNSENQSLDEVYRTTENNVLEALK